MPIPETPQEWYQENNCDHAHCPYDHEHPQPFLHEGVMYCGCCAFEHGLKTVMIPCSPETCKE